MTAEGHYPPTGLEAAAREKWVGNEVAEYGYENENRHSVNCFLAGRQPELDFKTGLEGVEMLMAAYMSAEQERTLAWKPEGLDTFVPAVARGEWVP